MFILSTFEHTIYFEMALSALEQKNITRENILAVPLNNRTEERKLFDTIHRADGVSLFDVAAALATAFSVIGASIGFQLFWGPIVWGVIGGVGGFILGFIIDLLFQNKKRKTERKLRGKTSELILIVHCRIDQAELVEKVLWDNLALGVAKLDKD